MAKIVILSTAYFPPIQYFQELIGTDNITIEACENYSRQSYRNRCNILSCNGILPLIIPVKKGTTIKEKITNIKIDYSVNWQKNHLNAIISAYGKSPFFSYYSEDILEPVKNKYDSLFELNREILKVLFDSIQIKKDIQTTSTYIKKYDESVLDYRNSINPKIKLSSEKTSPKTYIQTFCDRFDFIPNLSILDLIFNIGPETKDYLLKIK
jgi:hypothetical protein